MKHLGKRGKKVVIRFTVPGEPKGKARPRVVHNGNFTRAYTPKDTMSYETYVKWIYTSTQEPVKLSGQIEASIKAYYQIPKSMSKKDRKLAEEGKLRPTKKPDADNIAKIILDSLNGIAYKDDSQAVDVYISKYYAEDENPRVEVALRELEEKK